MIKGSCLCGNVQFELEAASPPFELCHCRRCRKVSGSAFMAGIGVDRDQFRWLCGQDAIQLYEAPIITQPPAYRVAFCRTCGSAVPDPTIESGWFEIPAGLLDDDPQIKPDKHIFTEVQAPWHHITDNLPQLSNEELLRLRSKGTD